MNETDVALYAWIVDGGGANGLAYKGSACFAGTGERSKTSLTRGPSRYDAIIETAEVNLAIYIMYFPSHQNYYWLFLNETNECVIINYRL